MAAVTGQTPWRELGDVPFGAFERELIAARSPIAPEARACWDTSRPHSALALAMSFVETRWGTYTCETAPAGAPCVPIGHRNALALKSGGRFVDFSEWFEGFWLWRGRLTDPAGPYADARTVADLIAVYAPASDGNDEARYVAQVEALLARWGITEGETMPTTYDLARDADAARFGLTPAERGKLLGYRIENRAGYKPLVIIPHIQDGNTSSSLDWWVNGYVEGRKVLASATVMIQRDGSILRVIPEGHGPWTNGDVKGPNAWGQKVAALGGGDPNRVSLTIEAEGRPWDQMPKAQFDSIVWQVADWQKRYGIPLANVGPHSAINSVDRANCGLYVPQVVKALAPAPTPTEPGVSLPPGVDAALATDWFGEVVKDGLWFRFDAKGGVSKLWVDRGRETGQWPALVDVGTYEDSATSTRRYFRFADGWTLLHVTGQPVRVVKGNAP